jgi:hypothetical protein
MQQKLVTLDKNSCIGQIEKTHFSSSQMMWQMKWGLVMDISLLKPFFLIKKNPLLMTTNLCLINKWIFVDGWKIQIMDEKASIWMKSLKKKRKTQKF